MGRTKEKKKVLHQPSTIEIIHCLSDMPEWSKVLLQSNNTKPYREFLEWLIQVNFKKGSEEKLRIKGLAFEFKNDPAKITKWIHNIYDDLLDLNYEQPQLFQNKNIPVTFYMKHFDDSGMLYLSLSVVPREYETVRCFFMKAKMGTDLFWVKQVEHIIGEDKSEIMVWLESGFVNRYREMAVDKAIFLEMIGRMELFEKNTFQIDKRLRDLPIHR